MFLIPLSGAETPLVNPCSGFYWTQPATIRLVQAKRQARPPPERQGAPPIPLKLRYPKNETTFITRPDSPASRSHRRALTPFRSILKPEVDWRNDCGLSPFTSCRPSGNSGEMRFIALWIEGFPNALRQLRRSGSFRAATVLIPAVGIGLYATIFTLVDCVPLKSRRLPLR